MKKLIKWIKKIIYKWIKTKDIYFFVNNKQIITKNIYILYSIKLKTIRIFILQKYSKPTADNSAFVLGRNSHFINYSQET